MTRKQRIILIISLCLYCLLPALMYIGKESETSLHAVDINQSPKSNTNAASTDLPQVSPANAVSTENKPTSNTNATNTEKTQASTTNAVNTYKPQGSAANAQQFLTHLSQHIADGTLGGNIPLLLTKEELAAKYRVNDTDYIASDSNSSYFERDGYRYFLYHQNGQEKLLVIGAQFHALTKEQILSTFGTHSYIDSTINHQIVYNIGEYIVLFAHTDPKNRETYNLISLSPTPAT